MPKVSKIDLRSDRATLTLEIMLLTALVDVEEVVVAVEVEGQVMGLFVWAAVSSLVPTMLNEVRTQLLAIHDVWDGVWAYSKSH